MNGAAAAECQISSPGGPTKSWDLYSGRQRGIYLFVLFLVGTSNYVDRNIIGVLLEPIKQEFGVSDTMLGLLSGISFALFYATLGIPVARWADRGDRRFIITISLTIWSLMTVLCGMAQNFWQLALARVGVGMGEAGAIPPAQSLIADYYPPDRRSKAIGVYMMCSMAGYVIGLVAGGWIAQHYGWRDAFFIVGLPGLLLALTTRFLLAEPRHLPQFAIQARSQEPVTATFRALFEKPSYRNIIGAMVLYFLMAYGALLFTASFMMRVHDLSVSEAGALFGGLSAAGAIVGNIGGGIITDYLAKRDIAWTARLPGWGLILALPLYEVAFMAPNIPLMAGALFLASIFLTGVIPPMFSALHAVCGSARRAMAVAIAFFFANLIGLGLGPVIAGSLSDWFAQSYGPADGLRFALMTVMFTFIPSGILMLRAARTLGADLED
ncbi:spinster family MFS transporter [Sphingopyxis fribergensis]